MAKEIQPDTPVDTPVAIPIPLRVFADTHALKYGIELMAGFFHEQERVKRYADTEENWHQQMQIYMKREVK